MTLREDGQGLENQLIGTSIHVEKYPFAVLDKMIVFPPVPITTPVGQKSTDWLKSLKAADILAQVPALLPYRA